MQFNVIAFTLATMASVAAAQTVTVYACASSSAMVPSSSAAAASVASSHVPTSVVASTGVVTAPTATGSPITFAGAASVNGVSALGLIIAGGVALFI